MVGKAMNKRFLKVFRPGVLIGATLLGLAAMGGAAAQQTPPVVRVDSGELQGVVVAGMFVQPSGIDGLTHCGSIITVALCSRSIDLTWTISLRIHKHSRCWAVT
jgi:hypothetical protein